MSFFERLKIAASAEWRAYTEQQAQRVQIETIAAKRCWLVLRRR
jgi:hypothetical protein